MTRAWSIVQTPQHAYHGYSVCSIDHILYIILLRRHILSGPVCREWWVQYNSVAKCVLTTLEFGGLGALFSVGLFSCCRSLEEPISLGGAEQAIVWRVQVWPSMPIVCSLVSLLYQTCMCVYIYMYTHRHMLVGWQWCWAMLTRLRVDIMLNCNDVFLYYRFILSLPLLSHPISL